MHRRVRETKYREEKIEQIEQEKDEYKETLVRDIGIEENGIEEKKERIFVVPGHVIATSMDLLPGDGTQREGNNIVAIRFGLLDKGSRYIRVIPLSGVYIPKKDDMVVGKILEITTSTWVIDINSVNVGMLGLAEATREFIPRNADLSKYYKHGDLVLAKVLMMKPRFAELTMRDSGRKLDSGLVIEINPNKVPRVIGRLGSMINLIKKETNCNIVIGQNGIIWIRGKNPEEELLARDAIKKVEAFSHIPELTERIKDFLDKNKVKVP